MRCRLCDGKSIYGNLCKVHFLDNFEKKIKLTIKKFKLLDKKDKVAVAVSGGKDSMALLHILHKLNYNVIAICVDEGIEGYRDKTLITMEAYCKSEDIPFKIVSFKENFGKSLDEIMHKDKMRPCTVCGVFRRYLLNLNSKGFDVIATGHNMDDEAQAIVMNIVKSNISLLGRLGPVSGSSKVSGFTKRVKPFYLCLEKEVMIYSFLNRLNTEFSECPNVGLSFRLRIRDRLNDIEVKKPGTKKNIVEWFLSRKKTKSALPKSCRTCGEPTTRDTCNACLHIVRIQDVR